MAKTVGCSDFHQDCAFRITADDDQESMMLDVATAHAMQYHSDFAPTESAFRDAIRTQIKSLMTQAHMPADEVSEMMGR